MEKHDQPSTIFGKKDYRPLLTIIKQDHDYQPSTIILNHQPATTLGNILSIINHNDYSNHQQSFMFNHQPTLAVSLAKQGPVEAPAEQWGEGEDWAEAPTTLPTDDEVGKPWELIGPWEADGSEGVTIGHHGCG